MSNAVQLSVAPEQVEALLALPEIVEAHVAERQKAFDRATTRKSSVGRKLDQAKQIAALVDHLVSQVPDEVRQILAEPPEWVAKGMCFVPGPGNMPMPFTLDAATREWRGFAATDGGAMGMVSKSVAELIAMGAVARAEDVVALAAAAPADEDEDEELDLADYEPEDEGVLAGLVTYEPQD